MVIKNLKKGLRHATKLACLSVSVLSDVYTTQEIMQKPTVITMENQTTREFSALQVAEMANANDDRISTLETKEREQTMETTRFRRWLKTEMEQMRIGITEEIERKMARKEQ